MRSPFPGMDPYLERRWDDVHAKLCAFIGEAIQPDLPAALRARTESRVLLEDESGEELSRYIPDAAVVEVDERVPSPARTVGGTVTLEPVRFTLLRDPPVHRWVKIIDVERGNRVVTAIEILSPGNKRPGPLNDDYREKIDDYIAAGVNVVEIDLLRGRRNLLAVRHDMLPPERAGEYLYCVHRARRRREWLAYPMRLRDRLPVVPVPLRPIDADVTLDLQSLIDRVYVAGGHDDIDYAKPADPPLSADDAAWLAERLAERARQQGTT